MKYGVFFTINRAVNGEPVFMTDDREIAKSKAKRRRAILSRGEREYYKYSYVIREIK